MNKGSCGARIVGYLLRHPKPHILLSFRMVERNALQEWVKWQVITAGICKVFSNLVAIDGGAFTLKYPYETYKQPFGIESVPFLPYFGPVARFGRVPSAEHPFASPVPASGKTIPAAGLIGMIVVPLIALLEADVIGGIMVVPDFFKGLLYAAIGVLISTQLTMVQPGIFMIFAGICLLYNSFFKSKVNKELPH